MQIYLDVIWLLNFLFDSLLLFITGLVLKRDLTKWKIFLGGLVGSLVIFAPFTPFSSVLTSPISKILLSLIMVLIAFGYRRLRYFLTNVCVFYLITFVSGGALIGLHYLLQFDYQLNQSIFMASIRGFGDPISWVFIILGFPILLYFSKSTFDRFETAKFQADQIVEVTLFINQEKIVLKGLIDTGNQLYDPLSRKPVMIASLHKLEHLFPQELIQIFENANQLGNLGQVKDDWLNKISIIPYKAVGTENRLIAAIKPDKISIFKDQEIYETNQVLIACVPQSLSSDGLFDCIIHPKVMNGNNAKQVS